MIPKAFYFPETDTATHVQQSVIQPLYDITGHADRSGFTHALHTEAVACDLGYESSSAVLAEEYSLETLNNSQPHPAVCVQPFEIEVTDSNPFPLVPIQIAANGIDSISDASYRRKFTLSDEITLIESYVSTTVGLRLCGYIFMYKSPTDYFQARKAYDRPYRLDCGDVKIISEKYNVLYGDKIQRMTIKKRNMISIASNGILYRYNMHDCLFGPTDVLVVYRSPGHTSTPYENYFHHSMKTLLTQGSTPTVSYVKYSEHGTISTELLFKMLAENNMSIDDIATLHLTNPALAFEFSIRLGVDIEEFQL